MAETKREKWATWDSKELMDKGKLRLVYADVLKIDPLEIDLADFISRAITLGNVQWKHLSDCLKEGIAFMIKQKSADGLAGKGDKASYSKAEQAAMRKATIERVVNKLQWDKPAGESGSRNITPKWELAIATIKANAERLQKTIDMLAATGTMDPMVKATLEEQISLYDVDGKKLPEWEAIRDEYLKKKAAGKEASPPESEPEKEFDPETDEAKDDAEPVSVEAVDEKAGRKPEQQKKNTTRNGRGPK